MTRKVAFLRPLGLRLEKQKAAAPAGQTEKNPPAAPEKNARQGQAPKNRDARQESVRKDAFQAGRNTVPQQAGEKNAQGKNTQDKNAPKKNSRRRGRGKKNHQESADPPQRQYSEQMNVKPSNRHPKKYEYKDNTRLKDDIITYTPDWGSPPSAPRFQPSSSARKKPQDQPLSDKPFRR